MKASRLPAEQFLMLLCGSGSIFNLIGYNNRMLLT
jgi:hypothetical protein